MISGIRISLCVWAAAALLAVPFNAVAQVASSTIAGTVTLEADGSPIHGALVIVVGARRTATTDPDGSYRIADVPPGTYEVLAQREHLTAARQTVTVAPGSSTTANFALTLEAIHEEVAVTASASGTATAFDSFSAVSSLDSLELAVNRGASLASVLADQPGVSLRSFGPGSARPVIRGFDGDRVLIMQDGMRAGDLSSQSGDHGLTLDPAGLERLEVVKGPATLLYGSSAIGGVVNAITPQDAFRASPFVGILGGVSLDTASGADQIGANGNIQFGRRGWTAWGSGGTRRTGDYDTPEGPVPNSETEMRNARGGLGWTGARAFFGAGFQVERTRHGVPFASAFHAHGEEAEHDDEAFDVDLRSTRRDLRLDTGARNLASRLVDNVKLTVALADYGHDEIEVIDGVDAVATTFANDTRSVRVELEQKRAGRLTGRLGVDAFSRAYRVTGEEALAPATDQTSFAAFAYEEVSFGATRVQFGTRLERNGYRPEPREAESVHEGEEPPAVRDRTFTGPSASVGVHRDIGNAAVVANFSVSSRAPALEELYNFGPHVGNLAFEVGNPDLELERSVGLDVSLRRRTTRMSGELNLFTYGISNFVFLDFTGEIADGLREARFVQGDSRYSGLEASTDVQLGRGVHLDAGFSLVRATLASSGEALPRIPPAAGRVKIELPWRSLTVTPEVAFARAQRRVFRDEVPTGGHTLLHVSATYFLVRGHATHALTVKGHNLTNEAYRLHTSFIKDLALEMGRSVSASYTVRFF